MPAAIVDVPVLSSKAHALDSGSPPFSTFRSSSDASCRLVKVQVTSSPAASVSEIPLVMSVFDFAVAVPVNTHARPVSDQPAGTVSTVE